MARPSDTAFGAAFNADVFRQAIKSTMQMGAPPEVERRATFVMQAGTRSYVKDGVTLATPPRLSRDGRPFDPEIAIVDVAPQTMQVDCAVEITRADAEEGPVGTFRGTKAVVTLLDVDYAQVKDCRELRFNGDRYLRGYEPEGLGLFDVGVNTMIFYAVKET